MRNMGYRALYIYKMDKHYGTAACKTLESEAAILWW